MCVIIWRYMRPRYLIAFPLVILAFCFSEAKCAAQSDMIWRVGGQYGVLGITYFKDKTEDFTMSLTLGFDMAVKDTPWRLGVEGGVMNQGIADYFFEEDEPDHFVRPNFIYAGAFTEYGFHVWRQPLFCRAGLGYALESDMWVHHVETKHVPIVITGFGYDLDYFKAMLNGYIAPGGILVVTLSGGFYFGRRRK